jgi:DNA-binding transcriptional LysR family regulator
MDLRRARTFVTIAELGSVSRAALHLRIAQPALSRQIAELEQKLGFKLFDRVGRGFVLTGQGEQLLVDCRGLLNHADAVSERAQLLRRGDTGVLKVAASPQFIEGALADFLHRYAQRFPNIQVKLREAIGWPEIRVLLERGEIHLGQNLANAVQSDEQRFDSHPLEAVEQLLAFQPKLAPSTGTSLDIKRLANHPLLLLDTSYIFRRTFDAACRLAGLVPNIAFESRTAHTLLAMAESGHGLAVIPSTMRMHSNRLRVICLTYQGKRLREPLAIFWDRRRPLPRYGVTFCQALADHVRALFPVTRASAPTIGAVRTRAMTSRVR